MNRKLKEIIKTDQYRYYRNTRKPFLWKIRQHDLYCISIYRKCNYYFKRNKLLYVYYEYKLKALDKNFGFHIPGRTKIGNGLFIGHNGPIIINTEAIIGKNCNIASGVTIGRENRGKRNGAPIIGNQVWIGTNAVIVGKIYIGDNVLIAPNSFVNFDVPNNSIVLGNPAKVIQKNNATDKYITNKI